MANPKSSTTFHSSHDMNFDYIIMDLILDAYENDKTNQRPTGRKPKGTGRHKKSPMQNGNSAVACLLLYIVMESIIRRKFYSLSDANRASAHTGKLFDRYKIINHKSTNLDEIEQYFNELTLIRDVISHAYIFEGEMMLDDEHKIVGLFEKAVGGKNKASASRRLTEKLRLHIAPSQISFKDIAIYYMAILYILQDAGLPMPHNYWAWKPGDDLEPEKWLIRAMRSLRYSNTKIWIKLCEQNDEAEYREWTQALEEAGLSDIRF